MSEFLVIAALLAGLGDAQTKPAHPMEVDQVITAVSTNDEATLKLWSIGEVTDTGVRHIDAKEALAMLSGCSQSDVRHLDGGTYTIAYTCLIRRALAKGCDTGDLKLFVTGSSGRLAVGHDRRFDLNCPLAVPPAPPVAK